MQRAVNPQTGEVLFLVNNQWTAPSQTARNPDSGQMAYLVNNEWQVLDPFKEEKGFFDRLSEAAQSQEVDKEAKTRNPLMGVLARASGLAGAALEVPDTVAQLMSNLTGLPKDQVFELPIDTVGKNLADKALNYEKDIGYAPSTVLKDIADNPLNAVPFIAERVITSVPDMAAAYFAAPAYFASRTNEILKQRVENDGKTLAEATVGDVSAAAGAAAFETTFEKFATGRLLPGAGAVGKTAPGRIAKETGVQSATEFAEEVAAYAGERAGTERGFDPAEATLAGIEGAIVGGGMGTAVQGTKELMQPKVSPEAAAEPTEAVTETPEAAEEAGQIQPIPSLLKTREIYQGDIEPVTAQIDEVPDGRFGLTLLDQNTGQSDVTFFSSFEEARDAAQSITGKREPDYVAPEEALEEAPAPEPAPEAVTPEVVAPEAVAPEAPVEAAPVEAPVVTPPAAAAAPKRPAKEIKIDINKARQDLRKAETAFKKNQVGQEAVDFAAARLSTLEAEKTALKAPKVPAEVMAPEVEPVPELPAKRQPKTVFEEKMFGKEPILSEEELAARKDISEKQRALNAQYNRIKGTKGFSNLADFLSGRAAQPAKVEGADRPLPDGMLVLDEDLKRIDFGLGKGATLKRNNLVSKTGRGRPLQQLIEDEQLNEFLPDDLKIFVRAEDVYDPNEFAKVRNAVDYIIERFENNDFLTEDDKMALRVIDEDIQKLSQEMTLEQVNARLAEIAAEERAGEAEAIAPSVPEEGLRGAAPTAVREPISQGEIARPNFYLELMPNAGFKRLALDDPKTYKNKSGEEFLTFERDGVRVAVKSNTQLYAGDRGVGMYMGNAEDMLLQAIIVDESARRQGLATKALKDILEMVDQAGLTVYVEPVQITKDIGMSTQQLKDFYKRFGFEPQQTEPATDRVMVRKPQKPKAVPEEKRQADLERDLFRLTSPAVPERTTPPGAQRDLFGAAGYTPANVAKRKKENVEQLSLFEQSPLPENENNQAGAKARREAVSSVEDLQSTNTPLALALSTDYARRQRATLVGQKITGHDDLAVLSQVYRNPKFETSRMFFVNDAGEVVSQLGVTSRLPSASLSVIGDDTVAYFNKVQKAAKTVGATGVWMLHNHPSGNVQPSNADIRLTIGIADQFKDLSYKGHIVIDTNKYSLIEPNGKVTTISKDMGQKDLVQKDPRSLKEIFNPIEVAKKIDEDPKSMVLIAIDAKAEVTGITTVSNDTFKGKTDEQVRRSLYKIALSNMGGRLLVASRDMGALDAVSPYVEDGILIQPNGAYKEFNKIYRRRSIVLFPEDRPGVVSPDTSKLFDFLRVPKVQAPRSYLNWPDLRKVLEEQKPVAEKKAEAKKESIKKDIKNYAIPRNVFGEQMPKASWDTPGESKMDNFLYVLQDKNIDTKRVVQSVKKQRKDLLDVWNPYLQEELYHGRTAKQTEDFLKKELEPLMEALRDRGLSLEQVDEYLQNRHAEERNIQNAKRDPSMPDGGSGIRTADAKKYLSALTPQQKKDFESVAKMVDEIVKGTQDLIVSSGQEKKEVIDAWNKAYKHYVPLNREEGDFDVPNVGTGVGSGFAIKGPFSRASVGSGRKVVDILANIAMQRERAIIRAEKLRVAKAVYSLAVTNPNPGFWLPVDPYSKKNPEKLLADLTEMGIDPDKAKNIAEYPTRRDIDPATNTVKEIPNERLVSSALSLPVRINGEEKFLIFNSNDPRAVRMVTSLRNLDVDQLNRALSVSQMFTQYFAKINTQYNPIFGAINFLRDVQGATLQLSTTPIAGKQKQVIAGLPGALRGIYGEERTKRKGKPSTEHPWAKLWEEFQQEGAQTGFRDMFSRSQERTEALQQILDPSSWTKSKLGKIFTAGGTLKVPAEMARKAATPLFDWLSDYNQTMENAVRLSAYKVALGYEWNEKTKSWEQKNKGMTKQQAASIAKNLTVNFNRKGQIGRQMGALYAFFNASVQGTARMYETLKGPAKYKIIGGGLLLGSLQAMTLFWAGFDEDEPPEFVKERNIVLPTGGSKYVTIPMPLGYNVIPNTSRILTEWILSGFKDTPKRISSIFSATLDMFNPLGNAGWSLQTVLPTVVDPAAALSENVDWTGKPIAKEDVSSLNPTPGYTRAKDTATIVGKGLSEFLNYASGGTKYAPGEVSPTPDQIDYLIGQFTGGVGREIMKLEQFGRSQVTGEDLPIYKVPLVGRFVGDSQGLAAERNRFYNNIIQLNKHELEIKGRRENKENVQEYLANNPDARLFSYANQVERNIQTLRKRRDALLKRDAPKDQIKAVENQIAVQMKRFNDRVAAAQQ